MGDKVVIYGDLMITKDTPPDHGIEVLGYHPLWEDADYNPNGWRICFQNDGIWCSTVWNNYQDYYHTYYPSIIPTHWCPIPHIKPQSHA